MVHSPAGEAIQTQTSGSSRRLRRLRSDARAEGGIAVNDLTITPQNDGPYQGPFKRVTEGGRIAVDGAETWPVSLRALGDQAVLRWHAHPNRLQEEPGRLVTGC